MEENTEIHSLNADDINDLLNIPLTDTNIPVLGPEQLNESLIVMGSDETILEPVFEESMNTMNSNSESIFDSDSDSQPIVDVNPNNDLLDSTIDLNTYINTPINNNNARFRGAAWFDNAESFDIIIGGVGGIGSFLALLLSRLNPHCIRLYDDDIISEVNMSGQFYKINDIDKPKVESLYSSIREYSGYYCSTYKSLYSTDSVTYDVMFSCFDNMEARKIMYNNWKNNGEKLFIDGRLAFEEFQILTIKRGDTDSMKEYEENWLFDSSEAEPTLCSQKQTTHMASMIASFMVNIYINYCYNLTNPIMERPLPFLTRYDATLLNFKRF